MLEPIVVDLVPAAKMADSKMATLTMAALTMDSKMAAPITVDLTRGLAVGPNSDHKYR